MKVRALAVDLARQALVGSIVKNGSRTSDAERIVRNLEDLMLALIAADRIQREACSTEDMSIPRVVDLRSQ